MPTAHGMLDQQDHSQGLTRVNTAMSATHALSTGKTTVSTIVGTKPPMATTRSAATYQPTTCDDVSTLSRTVSIWL